jgi:hypothetical protein
LQSTKSPQVGYDWKMKKTRQLEGTLDPTSAISWEGGELHQNSSENSRNMLKCGQGLASVLLNLGNHSKLKRRRMHELKISNGTPLPARMRKHSQLKA